MKALIPGATFIEVDFGSYSRIDQDGKTTTFTRIARIDAKTGNKAQIAEKMKADLQAKFEVVISKQSLPDEDPDKTIDPVAVHGETMFWDGANIIARSAIVESVFFNGGLWHAKVRQPDPRRAP